MDFNDNLICARDVTAAPARFWTRRITTTLDTPAGKRFGSLIAAVVSASVMLVMSMEGNGLTARAQTGTELQDITASFVGPGVECPQAMLPDGEQISLEGLALPELVVGQELRLSGQFQRASRCMQGRAFRVETLTIDEAKD